MGENVPETSATSERRLGSSWRGEGDASGAEHGAAEGPWLFLGLLAFVLGGLTVLAAVGLWLLDRYAPGAPAWVRLVLFVGVGAPLVVWWVCWFLCVAAVLRPSRRSALPVLSKWAALQATWLIPVGRLCGVARDRIGSSCLAVTNALARVRLQPGHAERPIILLPRCMAADVVEEARRVAAEWGCPVFVMETNEQARRTMREADPTCVITAACERDLLGGLFDYGAKLPILAIANRRPDGPCFGTHIDMDELREALTDALGAPKGEGGS